jgi:hypothetical protein
MSSNFPGTFHKAGAILLLVALLLITAAPVAASSAHPSAPPAPSDTIIVFSPEDDGVEAPENCPGGGCRLRDAVSAAQPGDTITFDISAATINLAGEIYIDKDLTIDGGDVSTVISGPGNSCPPCFRLFEIGASASVTLKNLTLVKGNPNPFNGGAIFVNSDSLLSIDHLVVDGNHTNNDGGAIYNVGSLTIINSTFSNNRSMKGAGARLPPRGRI